MPPRNHSQFSTTCRRQGFAAPGSRPPLTPIAVAPNRGEEMRVRTAVLFQALFQRVIQIVDMNELRAATVALCMTERRAR